MVSTILSATAFGTAAKIVEVEATCTRGLPNFSITGLANSSIQESKHRVQSALSNNNITLPPLKININLSPSDLPKNGGHFDLPIALALQSASHAPKDNPTKENLWFAFGELGLDGSVKHLDSIYPLLLDVALLSPQAKVIVPRAKRELLSLIPNLRFYFVDTLPEAIALINALGVESEPDSESSTSPSSLGFASIEVEGSEYFYHNEFALDFSEVRGQPLAKRAALIAAAGFHNLIMEGSPGCGKSMIAKRLVYILPPSSLKEMIENVKHQALNKQDTHYTPLRPFRSPHQSASKSSILGSATQYEVKPGEVALAHNGILFFDELPHFKKDVLESLREPLENNKLAISRVHSKLEYETNFLFIAAQNPCPCGNLLSRTKECRCQDREISLYRSRLSEPLLDRIDLFVQMSEEAQEGEELDSKAMQKRVFEAFRMQKSRAQPMLNGKLDERGIEEFCALDEGCQSLLAQASERFALSYRAQNKIKKLSRTIADLEGAQRIGKAHILEALSFRKIN